MDSFERFIEELIKDYFTANIKAEVPIDTLITPIISDICKYKLGETVLLTKEMPIVKVERTEENKNSRSLSCCNADFVLLSKENETVYIVELKTSESSEKEEQFINYTDRIKDKEFRPLMLDLFDILYKHSFNGKYNNLKEGTETENLIELVESILEVTADSLRKDSTVKSIDNKAFKSYTQGAEIYLRKNEIHRKNKDSSEKYLMTAARLLDALNSVGIALEIIADYKMKLVYILPPGADAVSDEDVFLSKDINPVDDYGKAVKEMFHRLWENNNTECQ